MPVVRDLKTMSTLRYGALVCYAVALGFFVAGMVVNRDRLRDLGTAAGIVGLAVDMRLYTARGVSRLITTWAYWQDPPEEPPTHRAPRPAPPDEPLRDA